MVLLFISRSLNRDRTSTVTSRTMTEGPVVSVVVQFGLSLLPVCMTGPSSTILDRFDLDNSLIPWLHVLTQTVRSSEWEASLRGSKFMLSYEQASKLTNAMMKDPGGVQNTTAQVCLNFLLISILTWNFCSCCHHPLTVSWYL